MPPLVSTVQCATGTSRQSSATVTVAAPPRSRAATRLCSRWRSSRSRYEAGEGGGGACCVEFCFLTVDGNNVCAPCCRATRRRLSSATPPSQPPSPAAGMNRIRRVVGCLCLLHVACVDVLSVRRNLRTLTSGRPRRLQRYAPAVQCTQRCHCCSLNIARLTSLLLLRQTSRTI
jgi:hypothetical protein